MRYSPSSVVLAAAAIVRLATCLPFEKEHQVRSAAYSVVNVNGGSSLPVMTVTATANQVSTATVTTTALPSSDVIVAIVDVVQGSQTSTLTITATPEAFDPSQTVTVDPTVSPSSADPPAATTPVVPKPPHPSGNPYHNSNSTFPHHNGTETSCGCGKHMTGAAMSTGAAHSTGFTAGSHVHLTNMPSLPKATPTWYNKTEIPAS